MSLPFPPEEGVGNHVYNLSRNLIKDNHEVTIITRGPWNKIQRENIDEIDVIRVPFVPLYPFHIHLHGLSVNKVFKSLESEFDVLHIHSPLCPLIKTSLPLITTIHTPMLTDYRDAKLESIRIMLLKIASKFVSYKLESKILHASDIVMTVSTSIAQELKENYYLNSDKVFTVGNGVDEKFFCPGKQRSKNDNRYILFVGHIDREKGLFDLLECGRYICRDRSDVSFILAGQGRDFNILKRRVIKLGLRDRFVLLGQVGKEKLLELYQNATLFVFPSYHEGLPTALLEAMSCSVPIIATDVRGNRDLISHGENGILVPSRNPKKLAEAISLILDDEHLRTKYGGNARKTIENNYTWDKVSDKILRCYLSFLEKQQ